MLAKAWIINEPIEDVGFFDFAVIWRSFPLP
jgi:hypothetical protein